MGISDKLTELAFPTRRSTSDLFAGLDAGMRHETRVHAWTASWVVVLLLLCYALGESGLNSLATKTRHWLADGFAGKTEPGTFSVQASIVVAGLTIFFILLSILINGLFKYLVDKRRFYYSLDRFRGKAIQGVNDHITVRFAEFAGCRQSASNCYLLGLRGFRGKGNPILENVFYHFTDRDWLGGHNQRAYQEHVFERWGLYHAYTAVYCVAGVGSCVGLIIAVFLYSHHPLRPLAFLVPLLLLLICLALWDVHGKRFLMEANQMADRQIDAILSCCSDDLRKRLAGISGSCREQDCPVKVGGIVVAS